MNYSSLIATALTPTGLVVLVLALLVLVPLLRVVVWWLFSFDERMQRLLHQKKSSEVKLGKMVESLAPLLDGFPVDVKKTGTSTVFLGQPVDFIHFDPEEGVTLIEVKSGSSKLSESQRKLKSLVQNGQVSWKEFRLKAER